MRDAPLEAVADLWRRHRLHPRPRVVLTLARPGPAQAPLRVVIRAGPPLNGGLGNYVRWGCGFDGAGCESYADVLGG